MDDDTKGAVGCFAVLIIIALVVAGIIYMPSLQLGLSPGSSAPSASSSTPSERSSSPPLTRAGPVSEKQVVEKAAKIDPMARKIHTGDETPPDEEAPQKGVVAMVPGLTILAPPPATLPPQTTESVQQTLTQEALCYHSKPARQVPSLFHAPGYAITFGADDFTGGDPYPRIELFYDMTKTPPQVTALSMTHKPIPEFPQNREVSVPYSAEAISAVIARWLSAVATDTCSIDSSKPAQSQ